MNKGFTIVELLVVIGLFGFISIVAVQTYLQVVQNSNRVAINSEIRQNTERVLSDIGSEVRKAACVRSNPRTFTLSLYDSVVDCENNTNPFAVYVSNGSPGYEFNKSGVNLLPANRLVACSGQSASFCSSTCSGNGFEVAPLGYTGARPGTEWTSSDPIKVTLTIRQKPGPTRSEFCGSETLSDSFTPRN